MLIWNEVPLPNSTPEEDKTALPAKLSRPEGSLEETEKEQIRQQGEALIATDSSLRLT